MTSNNSPLVLKEQTKEEREAIYQAFCDLPIPKPTFLDAAMLLTETGSDTLFTELTKNYRPERTLGPQGFKISKNEKEI